MRDSKRERSNKGGRGVVPLNSNLEKSLIAYSALATAAGVSLLALSVSAEAKIVYTPAHTKIPVNNAGFFTLDLNHDGIPDFAFWNRAYGYSFSSERDLGLYAGCDPIPVSNFNSTCRYRGNQIWGKGFVYERFVSALRDGITIGSRPSYFRQGPKLRSAPVSPAALLANFREFESYLGYLTETYTSGQWLYARHRYLGLRFLISGQVHFGWARLSVTLSKKKEYDVTLTGYAYETIAGKPIIAGKTKGPDVITLEPGSLGRLGQGAVGISAVRIQR